MVKNNGNQNRKSINKKHSNTPWFIAVLFLCITVLVLASVVFYVIKPRAGNMMIDRIFIEEKRPERLTTICIDENITLREIATETNMTYEELYNVMNIPPGTDPDMKLYDVYDYYLTDK